MYDETAKLLTYDVTVPYNTWFAVAYGTGMSNVDMMWLSASTTPGTSVAQDMWGIGTQPPDKD